MVKVFKSPTQVKASGNKPKIIQEYFGRVNSGNEEVSIARMESPGGWEEPGQKPEFDEYTVVLKGKLLVETEEQTHEIYAGQAVFVGKNTWVRYSSPEKEGAEYVAVCLPAFGPGIVHRDSEV